MSLLRIFCSLLEPPRLCQWALVDGDAAPVTGEGPLAQLPQGAARIQLVIPASQVLLVRAHLPPSTSTGRRSGSLLAYAVEENTASEPDANQVSWLGSAGGADVLAVVDRQGLETWRTALGGVGIHDYAVYCETLMLPRLAGGWSFAWNGREGFVRTGEFEGGATDCGDRESPPLSLHLMLEDANARDEAPTAIALYLTASDAVPDVAAWQQSLGVTILPAKPWDWQTAPPEIGISLLVPENRPWHQPMLLIQGTLSRLRPVLWIIGIALAIHSVALVADWTRLATEQRGLRRQMESRFRATFPDAVAVADPALQMRRKLAEARHAVNLPDDGDFPVMIKKVAVGLRELPAGALRAVSYESGRMTLKIAVSEEALVRKILARLLQAGLRVETLPATAGTGHDTVTMTVRAL